MASNQILTDRTHFQRDISRRTIHCNHCGEFAHYNDDEDLVIAFKEQHYDCKFTSPKGINQKYTLCKNSYIDFMNIPQQVSEL